jgi:alpha-1,2-mannosyltransferase
MLASAVIALLISPISWTHYWVWVIPGLVWGAHEVWYGRRWWGVAPLLTIVLLFFAYPMRIGLKGRWDERLELLPSGLVWTVPRTADQEKAWDLPQQVMGNLYVIVGVAALIVMAVWLAHTRWRDRLALRRLSSVTASQQAMSW